MNTLIVLLLTLSFISCNTNEPENTDKLILTVEDVSCTEAWLKIRDAKGSLITLKRDEKEIMQFKLTSTDTIVVDDSLLPNQSYQYKALSSNWILSNKTSATTMDTTSHNFAWQSWEFGETESSSLYDVAIIDENNIWAVGEIYMKDSLGNPDPHAYNAIHWDGAKWELKRIYFPAVCGSSTLISFPIRSIAAFDDGKIIFATVAHIAVLENNIQIDKFCIPSYLSIFNLWGFNSNNFFIVGYKGSIAHYKNGSWEKIDSGTNLDLNDIWGGYNNKGELELIAVGSNIGSDDGSVLLKIVDHTVLNLSTDNTEWFLRSICFIPDRAYYISSTTLYYKHRLTDPHWKNLGNISKYSITSISCNNINDVLISGSYGEILHFNGYNWQSFLSQTQLKWGAYGIVKSKNSIAVAAGFKDLKAIISIGIR